MTAAQRDDGRAQILARIRGALGRTAGHAPPHAQVPRDYLPADTGRDAADLLALFTERLAGKNARVHPVPADATVADTIAAVLHARGLRRVITPPGLNPGWLPADTAQWLTDEPALTDDELEDADAVLTAAAVGIADSATLVLDGGGQGRRRLSLVPDAMIVVLTADRLVADLPGAVARLDPSRPLTLITGPSATVDIELTRVDGVHGPRSLDVIVHGAGR